MNPTIWVTWVTSFRDKDLGAKPLISSENTISKGHQMNLFSLGDNILKPSFLGVFSYQQIYQNLFYHYDKGLFRCWVDSQTWLYTVNHQIFTHSSSGTTTRRKKFENRGHHIALESTNIQSMQTILFLLQMLPSEIL